MDEYNGSWITTYKGHRFHYLRPRPGEIDIEDIAHHLSLLCRFTGACSSYYSVAEHSIRVAELVPKELQLAALLHDASEAYIGDISRPVKYSHKLEDTEEIITKAIAKKYGVDLHNPEIKHADNVLCATEGRDLMPNMTRWRTLPQPLAEKIVPMKKPRTAEHLFLYMFRLYGGGAML